MHDDREGENCVRKQKPSDIRHRQTQIVYKSRQGDTNKRILQHADGYGNMLINTPIIIIILVSGKPISHTYTITLH